MSLFSNLVQMFAKGSDTRLVDNQQASQLIKNLDDMINESEKMLKGIKARVPASEFSTLADRHDELYTMVVEVSSDVRERQGNQVFFANAAEREDFYVQAQQVLTRCQIHHNDVLKVSRKTHERRLREQAADSSSMSPTPTAAEPGDESNPKWLAIVSESASSLDPSENEVDISSLSQSGSEPSSSTQQYTVTVLNIPTSDLPTEEELPDDEDSYYRMTICWNKRKRGLILDPKVHRISANRDGETAERLKDEILNVCDKVMKNDPQQLEGHQVLQNYQAPSFISSLLSPSRHGSPPLGNTA